MRSLKLGTLVTLIALALLAGACDNANFNMVIMYAVAPDADTCDHQIQDSESEFRFLSHGMIDLGHPIYGLPDVVPNYYIWMQVHNYTQNNGDDEVGRINSRDVMLQTVEVSYAWIRNESLLASDPYQLLRALEDEDVSIPMSGMVGAAASPDEPGRLLLGTGIIPHHLGSRLVTLADFANDPDNLSQLVLGANIRVVGTTLGGTRVESTPLLFPIYFCFGCVSGGVCSDGVTPMEGCVPGQDGLNPESCPDDAT
ncbi:MAG TPA: hypothetical protein PK668_19240 [Myxococcota bacterium]|nr:hypothetical protein [Myxococcota bacterium]HRY95134.1 hypothetical protein [Myxococcota bacterium]